MTNLVTKTSVPPVIPEDVGSFDAIDDLPDDAMYAAGLMEKPF